MDFGGEDLVGFFLPGQLAALRALLGGDLRVHQAVEVAGGDIAAVGRGGGGGIAFLRLLALGEPLPPLPGRGRRGGESYTTHK